MAKAKPTELHYDKAKLMAEYRNTYGMFIKALALAVGGAVLFFFIMIVGLGGLWHTKAEPWVKEFGSRIEYEYNGTKLPEFGGPEKPEAEHE